MNFIIIFFRLNIIIYRKKLTQKKMIIILKINTIYKESLRE